MSFREPFLRRASHPWRIAPPSRAVSVAAPQNSLLELARPLHNRLADTVAIDMFIVATATFLPRSCLTMTKNSFISADEFDGSIHRLLAAFTLTKRRRWKRAVLHWFRLRVRKVGRGHITRIFTHC